VERRVKERLVGAAVLVAAAVILIPEMLSGPKRREDTSAKSQESEPFKTYTIDLNRSPGASASPSIDERAPPPEAPAPTTTAATEAAHASAPDSESPADNPPEPAQASPESASPEPATPPQRVAAEPTSAATPPVQEQNREATREAPARTAIASAPSVPTSRGWAVQLGCFSSKATADRIASEASGSGQTAFVMPVKSGANTLYRVRVGPFADRAAANAALVRIKQRVANAAVVAHP
jgi:DedD protein